MAAKPKIKFVDEIPGTVREQAASKWDPFIEAALDNPTKVVAVPGQPNGGGTSSVKNVIKSRGLDETLTVASRRDEDGTYTYYITAQV